jgi:8-oxo-dGTP diphosphatase
VSAEEKVQAAGGVVLERVPEGIRMALIHRPKYDDWTLPKGKVDPGETHEEAALREVEEETGLRCRPGRELSSVEYRDAKDRPKVVRYWLMEACEGEFSPNKEVDELRWVTAEDAVDLLSHDHDRELIKGLLRAPI